MNPEDKSALATVLERSQNYGFLGPGDPQSHVVHAQGLLEHLKGHFGEAVFRGADLGSGGGVPGLIEALTFPESRWLFIETMEKRAQFLEEAVSQLGLTERITVINQRAELVGQSDLYRGQFDTVSSRSFGLPAITAECAAPLLRLDGVLLVSEPPVYDPKRWSVEGLGELGMSLGDTVGGWLCIAQKTACPNRYPRRVGIPNKRPLWIS